VQTKEQPTTQVGKQALSDAVASYASSFSSLMVVCAALMVVAGLVALVLLRKGTKTQHAA